MRNSIFTATVSYLLMTFAVCGNGLVALYDFSEAAGNVVYDRSGQEPPLNLKIGDVAAVDRQAGALTIRGKTLIRTVDAPQRFIDAVRESGEITVEAWVQSADDAQSGPARIVTLSRNTRERNWTLGQDGNRFDFRFRTSKTTANGIPSVASPKGSTKSLSHVVYTRDRQGDARLYVNGKQVSERRVAGDTSTWDKEAQLALGNELTNNRPWRGTYYGVAIFSRSLSLSEIAERNANGSKAISRISPISAKAVPTTPQQPSGVPGTNERFELEVAPILANHCIECHDPASRKGGLDLSTKKGAFAGGDEGKAIVPRDLKASLLWTSVASDDMPHKRDPLTSAQKESLKSWLQNGAPWTAAKIDPATYAASKQATTKWIRRLTIHEYINTVRATFDVDLEDDARKHLPPDLRADGFANTAYNLAVDFEHVIAYAKLAELTAQRVDAAAFAKRFSRSRRMIDKDMIRLIEKMGETVLRGPLEKHEVAHYRGLTTTIMAANGSFDEAVRYLVEAMMQSPRFIYRVEGESGQGRSTVVAPYALASRLSYLFWGGPPDQQLLTAAKQKKLATDEQLRSQVARLLKDPQAEKQAMRFASEWLHLDRLVNLRPDPTRFPNWDPALAADMRQETLAYFNEVAWKENRPLGNLFNAQLTFATPRLAKHYGLPPTGGNELGRYDLANVPARGGLLTQASLLTVGGDDASMVTRGLFILHDVLRGVVKSPPAGVDTTPVPAKPGQSNRQVAELRIRDKSCGGCHSKFEPMAFAFAKYNGIGAHADHDEHGNVLREDGSLLIPGAAKAVTYASTAELMQLLAESDRVQESLTWKITQFAVGRPLGPADRVHVDNIHAQATAAGGTYRAVLTAIALSDLVRKH